MLSRQDNELLTRTGAGTPMGNYFRRFWQPVLLSREFSTRVLIDGCFRAAGAEPEVIAEMNTIAPMLELARRLPIAAIVPEKAVDGMAGLKAIAIENPKPIRTPAIVWKRGKPQSSLIRSFAEIVKQTALRAASR